MKKPKKPSFDCVEMKKKAQEKIYEETKHMSKDALLRYFNSWGEKMKKKRGTPPKAA